ncbi:MAG: alpha/beta fold hydrolase [Flavobacteriales bacterium]|nr:alpha/beta fold hydrolase [Flavobacteriales bacterium]
MLDNWHNIAKKLSEKFTVYAVDVRNHGSSPHSNEMSYNLVANDLQEFMDDHNIQKAHFIGHSMGGKAVMKMADLHPAAIDKMILVDIAPKRYKPGHNELFDAMFGLDLENIETRTEADQKLSESIKDAGIRLFLLKNIERKKEGGFQWKMNLHALYHNYDSIIGEVQLAWPFSNPCLFIRGEKSNYILPSDESKILEKFPNAQFETVENAGHWVHADNSERFLKLVLKFL